MAIQITEQPTNPPHNAYNNSIIEFGVDAGTPVTAVISIGEYSFEISADANGEFYFDFKSIIKALINQSQFSDAIEITNPASFLFNDASLFLELALNIEVTLSDDTVQSLDVTFPFIKSVEQVIRRRYENSELKILAPYANDICHLSYFEGYPFDVSVYSDIDRAVTITSTRTGLSTLLNLKKGVNRIFISNGENDNLGFESQLPLYLGVNELEFSYNNAIAFTLFLDKKPVECGKLLKWFNQDGGWSYWRFLDLYMENIKTDTLQRLNKDFNNLKNSSGNFTITGKESEVSQELFSGLVNEHELKVIKEVISSPRVFLYTNEELQPFETRDFVDVEVGGDMKLSNKYPQKNIGIEILLPKTYTQTL